MKSSERFVVFGRWPEYHAGRLLRLQNRSFTGIEEAGMIAFFLAHKDYVIFLKN
jgi:hypothetical protein